MSRKLDDFLERFVLPLCAGGEVHVAEPIGADLAATWATELPRQTLACYAIDRARANVVAEIAVRPPLLTFGGDELYLTVALHDALLLAHPDVDGRLQARARRDLATSARTLAAVSPPLLRDEVLARHSLLHRLPELVRVDTRVAWWSGRASFRGEAPPKRLLRWRGLRRVREEHDEVPLAAMVEAVGADVLDALFAASPLTDLLSLSLPARRPVAFRWGTQVIVLRDVELARALAYRWLEETNVVTTVPPKGRPVVGLGEGRPAVGLGGGRTAGELGDLLAKLRAVAAAASAWERALTSDLPAEDLRAVTGFFIHLGALLALAETAMTDLDAPSPLFAPALGVPGGRGALASRNAELTGLGLFLAIPEVAARVDPELALPVDGGGDPRLARRLAVHRAAARDALGEERLVVLARRFAAHLAA